MVGTLLGIIPGTLAIASVGAGLDAVIAKADLAGCIAKQGPAACRLSIKIGALLNTQLVAALVLRGVVALLPVAIRRRTRK